MTSRDKHIYTILSFISCFIVLGEILPRFVGSYYVHLITPLFWLLLSVILWIRPRVRFESKLKLRPFLLIWVLITAALYVITFFSAGSAFNAMARSPYTQKLPTLFLNITSFVSVPIMMEWIRNYIINGAEKKRHLLNAVFVSLLFIAMQLDLHNILALHSMEDIASFLGGEVMPAVMLNAFLSYVVYLGGAPMGMIYQAVTIAPIYLLPVLPDLNWLAKGIIGTIFPLFSLYVLHEVYMKRTGQIKERESKKESPFGWIATLVVSMALVWFIAGLFPIYPVTIMSGSMEPLVYAGDVVVMERTAADKVKIGDIVQYWKDNIFIIHRVIDTDTVSGETVYITKGDNNNVQDLDPVKAEQIRGKVITTVPKIGYLTYLVRSH